MGVVAALLEASWVRGATLVLAIQSLGGATENCFLAGVVLARALFLDALFRVDGKGKQNESKEQNNSSHLIILLLGEKVS